MKKSYVIDTNVLVHDYSSFSNILKGNKVYIPYVVLEELDRLKTREGEVGFNARSVIKEIEKQLIANNEDLIIVNVDNKIELADDKILAVCLVENIALESPTLVSNDVCLRTKARAKKIKVEEYKQDKVNIDRLYSGVVELIVDGVLIEKMYRDKELNVNDCYLPNQAVILVDECNPKLKAITIYKNGKLVLIDNKVAPFGLDCANLEQQIAVNYLLDPDIKLVTICGKAGSGKSLISVAAALENVLEQKLYHKVSVAKPIMAFQKDIGFLPGEIENKISPWFGSIFDSLEYLFSFAEQPKSKRGAKITPFEELEERGVIEMCPLTFIRGRSIPNQFIILDEAQNATPSEMKTILTRAGEGTKIVVIGDQEQIDANFLTIDNNGLVYCIDKFKDQSIAAHITFTKCERSELADISSKIL